MAINFRGAQFLGELGELTGYKSGLALDESRFKEIFVAGGYDDYWPDDPDQWIRIRSEVVEELFAFTLAQLGAGPKVHVVHPTVFVYHRVKDDPAKLQMFYEISPKFLDFLKSSLAQGDKVIKPVSFIRTIAEQYGSEGFEIAMMMSEALAAHQLQSPWAVTRRVEWKDIRELQDLFDSERLDGPHGEFFDERFANFLAANFDEVGTINWRQFEGLAAEFFKREGYAVELGPGRNDDGVDIRLRPDGTPEGAPAVILVQCKRQRAKIDKAVVKALWADIVAEGAESGVIVTTSSFSPGAATTRSARGYPIVEADRERVREFVEALKSPGNGLYLAE